MRIVVLGVGTDGTFRHVATAAAPRAHVVAVDLAEVVASGDWRLSIPDDGASRLVDAHNAVDLDPDDAYVVRLADLSAAETDPRRADRWRALTGALGAWLDHIPGPVANRPSALADNGAKPLHEARLARAGFAVPQSLTSSDPARLSAFAAAGPTVVKALSGVRATARPVGPEAFADGFTPARGPVHLQRRVGGVDVRAHVCGTQVVAQRITPRPESATVLDYREIDAADLVFTTITLPGEISDPLVAETAASGLVFAGWDLRLDEAAGVCWVLEANPMPGYDWYDRRAGGRITAALVDTLTPAVVAP